MPGEDKLIALRVTREFTRRAGIDASDMRVTVCSGVVYLAGRIKPMRGAVGVNIRHDFGVVEKIIRRLPGIRDVVNDCDLPS